MILDQFRLDGKVALVTGGSRGLGLGMAMALAEAGADIVSVQRGENTAELEACISRAGRDLLTVSLDIAKETAAEQAQEVALARFGHVDILVNNAGVQRRAPAIDFRIEDWDTVINVKYSIPKKGMSLSLSFHASLILQGCYRTRQEAS